MQSGDKAFLWGLLAQAGRGERTKGVKDALEAAGLTVIYQEIDDATNAEAAAGVPVFTGIMSANPDIKLMVTDHGNLTGTVQSFLEAAGKQPGEVYAAGFDMSGNAVKAIQDGWLQLVIDQQQFCKATSVFCRFVSLITTVSPVCRSIRARALRTKTISTSWPRWWRSRFVKVGPIPTS